MWRRISEHIIQRARVYNRIQRSVGSARIWSALMDTLEPEITQLKETDIWLDLGCGTAEFLAYLPDHIHYIGIDCNPKYIHFAKRRYQHRPNTQFICGDWHQISSSVLDEQSIRVISLLGLLHHLNDADATQVLRLGERLLDPDGLLFSLDGCPDVNSSRFERFFYWIDRGQFIRTEPIMRRLFPSPIETSVHPNWLVVPYRYLLCIMRPT